MHVCTYLRRISSIWILVSKKYFLPITRVSSNSVCGQETYKWAWNILLQNAENTQWLKEARSDPIWHYLNIKENNDSN